MVIAPQASQAAPPATHGNLNVHVHDDYYHPAGAFLSFGITDHNVAKQMCEAGNPIAACDAVIHAGDTITWVSPAPLAVNLHSVTECTDGTFTVCGAGVAAANPIEDSGVRTPPSPGPSGWPYGPVQFNAAGTYFYRCEVHPAVMRGRIVVQALLPAAQIVGGIGEFVEPAAADATSLSDEGSAETTVIAMFVGAGVAIIMLSTIMAWRRARRS